MLSNNTTPTTFQKWLPMFFIALSLAIIVIDGTVLNVSQKLVIDDLKTDLLTIQWAFTSYSLVLAALTIFGGRLGDIFGRLRMFRTGAILFAVGSLITALAHNVGILILGWSIIEGIGAALMTPAASALIVSNYQGKDRGTAFAIFGAVAGGSSAFGPIIGGFLSKYGTDISQFLSYITSSIPTMSYYFANFAGWRWAFGINVFIVIGLLIGSKFIKDDFISANKINLDYTGVLLSSLGLTSIVYGIIESTNYGWFTTSKLFNGISLGGFSITFYTIIIGILLLITFYLWETKEARLNKDPMINFNIFKNRTFTFGILTLATLFAGFTGIITYGVVFYFLTVLNLDSLGAGLGLLPFSIMTFIMAPISAKLALKIGGKLIVQIGLCFIILGCILYYIAFQNDAQYWSFMPGSIVFGTGFGLMVAQINNLILSSVEVRLAGVASGINGTIREVGRTIGVAVIGAAFITTLTTSLKSNLENNTNISTQAKSSLITAADKGEFNIIEKNALTDQEIIQQGMDNGTIPGIVNKLRSQGVVSIEAINKNYLDSYRTNEIQIKSEVNKSITSASKTAIAYTMCLAILALLFSFGIENFKKDN